MSLWKARNKNGKIEWIKGFITQNRGGKSTYQPVFETGYMGFFLLRE